MIKLHFYFRHNYLLCYILLPLHFAGIKPAAIPFPCILHVFPNFSCISFLEIGIQKCRDFANTNYLYTSIPVCIFSYVQYTVQYSHTVSILLLITHDKLKTLKKRLFKFVQAKKIRIWISIMQEKWDPDPH